MGPIRWLPSPDRLHPVPQSAISHVFATPPEYVRRPVCQPRVHVAGDPSSSRRCFGPCTQELSRHNILQGVGIVSASLHPSANFAAVLRGTSSSDISFSSAPCCARSPSLAFHANRAGIANSGATRLAFRTPTIPCAKQTCLQRPFLRMWHGHFQQLSILGDPIT